MTTTAQPLADMRRAGSTWIVSMAEVDSIAVKKPVLAILAPTPPRQAAGPETETRAYCWSAAS